MKHCWCGWSGDDSYERCPDAEAHPTPSVERGAASITRERERFDVVAGGFRADGLRPVRHFLSDKIEVYQDADGRYVTADGRKLPGRRKGLR
jgi:hypothetical protein